MEPMMNKQAWLTGLSLLAMTHAAHPALLRPVGSLTAATVKLSDLFDDLDAGVDRVIGPGPAPGGRIIVEAAQLGAIARQFGVDWRPSSQSDHVVLERPGRPISRDEILHPLRAALDGVGAPADAELELPGFAPPLIVAEGRAEIAIAQLEYDSTNGRFTATVAISGAGISSQKIRLLGTVIEMIEIPVPTHRLLVGSVVRAEDLQPARMRAGPLTNDVARGAEQVLGLAARRTISRGQPIVLADLGKPVLVAKGAHVSLQLQSGALIVSANGQAMESGALGDRITVLNPTSRSVIEAEIIGAGRARVLPDSAPIVQPGGTRVSSANFGAGSVLR
jgi:flagella basal body P-ring formation protein FlgA